MTQPDWAPTTADVAAYVPTRTVDDYPNPDAPSQPELGTPGGDFTTETTPTKAQVESFIDAAVWVVNAKVKDPTTDGVRSILRQAAAVRAAAMVELSSPRSDTDVNVYQELLTLYGQLISDATEVNISDGADGSGSGNLVPQYSFPAPVPWGDVLL